MGWNNEVGGDTSAKVFVAADGDSGMTAMDWRCNYNGFNDG